MKKKFVLALAATMLFGLSVASCGNDGDGLPKGEEVETTVLSQTVKGESMGCPCFPKNRSKVNRRSILR